MKTFKSKEKMINTLKKQLSTNKEQAIKGMLRIYEYQTATEKEYKETKFYNNVGFNGNDAKLLSSFVEFYNKNSFLTNKQLYYVFKKMPKYARQLINIALDTGKMIKTDNGYAVNI